MKKTILNIKNKLFVLKERINNQTIKKRILFVSLYLISSSLFLTIIVAFSQHGGFYGGFSGVVTGFSEYPIANFLTFIFILMINCSVYLISSSFLIIPFLIYWPITVLAIANYEKIYYRREALVPFDFMQIREALNIVFSSVKIDMFSFKFILIIFLFFLLIIGSFFIKKVKIKLYLRIIFLIFLPVSIYFFAFSQNCLVNKLVPSHITENAINIYNRKGFLLGFLSEISKIILKAPDNYTKENVQNAYNVLAINSENESNEVITEKPNIIVILSEAFTDPTVFENIEYSIDPLSAIREYMDCFGYLSMISPQFGGGTANVEYEVLTGVSITSFEDTSMVYQQFLNKQHFSMASYLNGLGYTSLGIHPYLDWFFRRNKVYPLLGFKDFYSMESMENTEILGTYISDLSLSKEIVDKYEENNDNPVFISAISMQNHSLYNMDRYTEEEKKVTIKKSTIREDFNEELTEYVNGVYYASEALKYLIEYFEKVEEPTYIIMYGDHLPYFADHILEYYETLGYQPQEKLDYLLYRTPVIFWSNQEKEKIKNDYVSSFLLGKEILKYAGIKLPQYFQMLDEFNKEVKAVNNYFAIDKDDKFIYKTEFKNSILDNLNLIAYDINFGNNYLNYSYDK